VVSAAGYWLISGPNPPSTDPDPHHEATQSNGSVALVTTTPLKTGTITENITVYGKIIPAPGAVRSVSVAFQSQIRRIRVNNGQKVSQGDVLVDLEPSPNTSLQFMQAQDAYETAKQSLQHMQQRFDLKLATNDQLLTAKLTFEQARLRLESMKKQGIDGSQEIRADVGGLIKQVYVQEGAIVAGGNPLIEIVAQNILEARLGVEPEDIVKLQPNQSVLLARVNVSTAPQVNGKIRKISYAVNPSTRLVDVFVTLPSSAGFLLGESVLGNIVIASSHGMIAPRTAVLPENGHHILFTVQNGRAVKHVVRIGLENDKEYEVSGPNLQPGQPVVIRGNYELKEGMAVKQKASP
jgi:membrane fusion protein (multidrug efflux system)